MPAHAIINCKNSKFMAPPRNFCKMHGYPPRKSLFLFAAVDKIPSTYPSFHSQSIFWRFGWRCIDISSCCICPYVKFCRAGRSECHRVEFAPVHFLRKRPLSGRFSPLSKGATDCKKNGLWLDCKYKAYRPEPVFSYNLGGKTLILIYSKGF